MLERGGLVRLAVGSGSARMAGARTSSRWKRGMSNPLSRIATRVAYGASQLPRVAWYIGHGLAMRRLAEEARRRDGGIARQRAQTNAPVPDRRRLYADMAMLLWQDLANVEAGLYPLPVDHNGSLLTLLHRSRLFFEDLPEIYRRRESGGHREVLNEKTAGKRPRYYLQNFHFQSGGWMTEESARRYDTQVEVLFNGTANATRHLRRWSWINFVVGNAESIPAPDASYDAVTSIFMFHELPPKVRRIVFGECARVLKPGGRFVLLDSLQRGDQPDYEGLFDLFPQNYHEPYYASYTTEDFGAIARACGLTHKRNVKAFVSKVMVFDKPVTA